MATDGDPIFEFPINALVAKTSGGDVYVIPSEHLSPFRRADLENNGTFHDALVSIKDVGLVAAAYVKGMVTMSDSG